MTGAICKTGIKQDIFGKQTTQTVENTIIKSYSIKGSVSQQNKKNLTFSIERSPDPLVDSFVKVKVPH